jgi:hypothetical protein
MIGITIVQNILAKNNPKVCSDAKRADINETRYMDKIKAMPTMAATRFTLFIIASFLMTIVIFIILVDFGKCNADFVGSFVTSP